MTTLVEEANRTEELRPDHGIMITLRPETAEDGGDSRHTWNRRSPIEVEEARALFTRMTKERRYQAWSVTRKGDKDQIITEFDPEAEKIIFAPALVGG
jgi:hypothetical protein